VWDLRNEHCFPSNGAVWWQGHHPDRRCLSRLLFSPQRYQVGAKISAGEIAIPLVRIESSQKSAKGVYLTDLAVYLDVRIEAARKELKALIT
jgi:hypothetical protein